MVDCAAWKWNSMLLVFDLINSLKKNDVFMCWRFFFFFKTFVGLRYLFAVMKWVVKMMSTKWSYMNWYMLTMNVELRTWTGLIVRTMHAPRYTVFVQVLANDFGIWTFFGFWLKTMPTLPGQIRANHLSGDCHFKRELLRGNLKIGGQESVRIHPFIYLLWPYSSLLVSFDYLLSMEVKLLR